MDSGSLSAITGKRENGNQLITVYERYDIG
jgi:hypothetical protein